MWSKLLVATGLTLALALPAAAQSTQSQSSGNSNMQSGQQAGMNGQNTMHIRQHVKDELQQAGFTNVQVMPESFLVRAKDKQGSPVMMVINPDSITAITEDGNRRPVRLVRQQSGSNALSNSTASKQ